MFEFLSAVRFPAVWGYGPPRLLSGGTEGIVLRNCARQEKGALFFGVGFPARRTWIFYGGARGVANPYETALFDRDFHIHAFGQGPFADFSAQSRTLGHLEFAVDWLEIYGAQTFVIFLQVDLMMFMNYKIGDHAFQVKRGGGRQRRCTDMRLDGNIVCIGHIADFLAFGDAAAVAKIRLNHLDGHVFKIGRVLPAGIDAFTV